MMSTWRYRYGIVDLGLRQSQEGISESREESYLKAAGQRPNPRNRAGIRYQQEAVVPWFS